MPHQPRPACSADVIVIGGGFAGVVAAREAALGGLEVLLVEARNRLGGRVWTREFAEAGMEVEVGGTWLLPSHDALLTELRRYSVATTQTPLPEHFVTRLADDDIRPTATISESGLRELAAAMQTSMGAEEADAHSLAVVAEGLSVEARAWLEAWNSYLMGAPLDQTSGAWRLLLDRASLEAIDAYSSKIEGGTQALVEAVAKEGAFTVSLGTRVTSVHQNAEGVEVVVEGGDSYFCAQAIIALPVNTWGDIAFEPPLSESHARLADERHSGRSVKVWMIVRGVTTHVRTMDPYGGFDYLRTERLLDDGRALLVGFAHADRMPQVNDAVVGEALRRVIPEATLVSIDFYDWNKDPFAQGTWMTHKPGQWMDVLACGGVKDRLIFAGGDIDARTPGTMDGAVRSGRSAGRLARDAVLVNRLS